MFILTERHIRVQIHDWIIITWITHNEYIRETQTQISFYTTVTDVLVRLPVKILENVVLVYDDDIWIIVFYFESSKQSRHSGNVSSL